MTVKVFKIGKNRLVTITMWLSYILGLWPRDNSTIIYVIVGYAYQSLTTFAWTVAKCIGTAFVQDNNEFIMLAASSMYCAVAAYRIIIILRKSKTIDVCLDAISEFHLTKSEYEMLQPKMKIFSYLSSTYTTFIFSGLVSAFLNPVLSVERVMPVPIWLPFIHWEENDRDYNIALVFSVTGIMSMVNACKYRWKQSKCRN